MSMSTAQSGFRSAWLGLALLPIAATACDRAERSYEVEDRLTAPTSAGAPAMDAGIVFGEEPIAAVGHGAVLLPEGKFIVPTREFALAAQHYYLERLKREADVTALRELDEVERAYRGDHPEASEPAVNARAIAWLLDRVHPEERARWGSINAYLEKVVAKLGVKPLAPRELTFLDSAPLGGAYVEQCEAAGVPVPPEWRKAGSAWVNRGVLDEVFVAGRLEATVYTYTSPDRKGVCYALPRTYMENEVAAGVVVHRKGDLDALGVICQGSETSRACFWDNIGDIPGDAAVSIPGPYMQGGPDLLDGKGGVCTSCHRGENAFIIHPESRLNFDEPLIRPRGWVNPMVHVSWFQNRKPSRQLDALQPAPGGVGCTSCHSKGNAARLGEFDAQYCGIVQSSFTRGERSGPTMPPKRSGMDIAQFATHIAAIQQICRTRRSPGSTAFESPRAAGALRSGTGALLMGELNGDGRADLVQIADSGELSVAAAGADDFAPPSSIGSIAVDELHKVQTGDFDADGVDDLAIVMRTGKISVALGGRLEALAPWGTSGVGAEYVLAGDFDNDRRDDLVTFTSEGVSLHRATTTGFERGVAVQVDYIAGEHVPLAGDIDGDSVEDLLLVAVRDRSRTLFARSQPRAALRFAVEQGPDDARAPEGTTVQLDDVDGDGLADLVTASRAGVFVVRHTATGLSAHPAGWLPAARWSDGTSDSVRLGDVDADGRADLISIDGDGALQIARSIFVPSDGMARE